MSGRTRNMAADAAHLAGVGAGPSGSATGHRVHRRLRAEEGRGASGALGVQSRSVMESAMLILYSGRPYGTDFFTAAPRPRTPSELLYSDRRLRSKSSMCCQPS